MNHEKRARAPKWWGRFTESLPKFNIPGLEPKAWTPQLAEKWVKMVPPKCPFERELRVGGVLLLYIPPLCPLNPISPQLYSIRIKAQAYLASLPKEPYSV